MNLATSPLRRRLGAAAGVLLLPLLAAVPAHAASGHANALRADRPGAERALDRARSLARGHGAGRDLTPALAALSGRLPALDAADRSVAGDLLARPTDPADTGQPGGPYTVPSVGAYTDHFCFHWVESTADAPSLADADQNDIPDYIEQLADTFETVYARENGATELGWRAPKSDGTRGGCAAGRTDVYVKDIGRLGLYGYAAPDPDQPTGDSTRYAFLVMDDDYSAAEFPEYGGDPTAPMEVTAAHEYNHVLQFGYDVLADGWMLESTATWMEEKVFPDIDDYHQYLGPWSQRSTMPMTQFKGPGGDKVYGSAVFNRWLDDRYGEKVVRRAWEVSAAEGSLAPAAYDHAIREAGGPGFSPALDDLAVATAEWHSADSGVHEGAAFPDMQRIAANGQPITLPADGTKLTGKLDHTGYALFDVARPNGSALKLTGGLANGVAGAIALVGRAGGHVTKALAVLPAGGTTSVTLPDPGRYERITAVVVNSDYAATGWNGTDWIWSHDAAPISLAVTAVTSTGGGTTQPGGGTTQPGGGTTQPGGGTTQPGGGSGQAGAPVVALRSAGRARLATARTLGLTAEADRAGAFTARALVDAKTARRLGLGRRATVIGAGRAQLRAAGATRLAVGLTSRARARLKKQRRPVSVRVEVTFSPAGGGEAARKVLTVRLAR